MALQIGPLVQQWVSKSGNSLVCPEASGGTGPYTYQWYRDIIPLTDPPGPTTALAGQTGLNLQDTGLQENTIYYYAVVATDTGDSDNTVQTLAFASVTAKNYPRAQGFSNPSIAKFQSQFRRDFPFGYDEENTIEQQDVAQAFQQTNVWMNPLVVTSQSEYTLGYLFLAAHYLVEDIQNSSQGIVGEYNFLQASKGAQGLGESYAIPQRILDHPVFSMFVKTKYGKKYLALIAPNLNGAMFSVRGYTKP